jgi:hypothetical protein
MRTLRIVLFATALMAPLAHAAYANPVFGLFARLHAGDEVPAVLSNGGGAFRGSFAVVPKVYAYSLHYFGLKGSVTEIDIHFAQPGVNGAAIAVLCSNLGTAPAGTQPCPITGPATISGGIGPPNLPGAPGQGVAPATLNDFTGAVTSGLAYVNIHTDVFPGGEVRGQISQFVISPASSPAD